MATRSAPRIPSFRRMYTITAPVTRRLEIPNGCNNWKPGKRPSALVAYTPVGARMMRVHYVYGSIYWELRDEEVDRLMRDLRMEEGEHLELESHSNTDVIIRAYYESGREKFFDSHMPPPRTHRTIHFLAVFRSDSRRSLNVNSTFANLVTPTEDVTYTLETGLSQYFVKGRPQPRPGMGFYLCDGTWKNFCTQHRLRPGMILVFEHIGYPRRYHFSVWFYPKDGHECTYLSGRPYLFNPTEYSFYRRRDSKFFQTGNLKLKTYFTEDNNSSRGLLFFYENEITISTLAGNFRMCYAPEDQPKLITGDWDLVFNANHFNNNKVKFQLSFNNVEHERSVIFAVSFVEEYFGDTSSEDGTGSGESFDEDSDDEFFYGRILL